ncbi:MAG: serine/threonine-protein kinase [Pirellulaceae bacterium]|nr:serine/threonine protein kinase [Planctomycetales bacterium]MCA9162755.1 serine/threonine protein kinase [Planctomycetales bacterium]MCA9221974.1 serine/threonine protein kinase [Planctomycetales bacterium]
MFTTTMQSPEATLTHGGQTAEIHDNELVDRYLDLIHGERLNWTSHHKLNRLLGSGGQGVVYLTERRGADDFTLPVALKFFSPARYTDSRSYDEAMSRIARVAAHVAQIQQDNLLDVHNFVDRNRIRLMVMEWIDGYDLRHLMNPMMLERVKHRVSEKRWEYLNRVVVTQGPTQPRFQPGVAVAVVRDCLAALAALHREEIVHSDIKPSNIMLKRTGNAKIVDIGSAFELKEPPAQRTCTPCYAAPEVIEGAEISPKSDLASLGYVLIELLAGQSPFTQPMNYKEMLEFKRRLPKMLETLLPADVTCNELLMSFCRGLIAPDPGKRFPSAEDADLLKTGAAAFHRQLVVSNMSSEYDNEIRLWIEELREIEDRENQG